MKKVIQAILIFLLPIVINAQFIGKESLEDLSPQLIQIKLNRSIAFKGLKAQVMYSEDSKETLKDAAGETIYFKSLVLWFKLF
jgi:hypothetical protein